MEANGKLISSDMCITWGAVKYGGVPVPSLFHMVVEIWESPMHVAVIRCILKQGYPMLHVLDSCYESGIPLLRNFTFLFDVCEFVIRVIILADVCECGGIVERLFRSPSYLRHFPKVGDPG